MKTIALGEIAPFKYGKNLPAAQRSETGEFPVITSAGIVGSHHSAVIEDPCVVIGRKGSIGSLTYAPNGAWPTDTAFYTTGAQDSDIRFIYYLLATLPLQSMNRDSAVPGLNRADAELLKVPFFERPQQQAIAEVLGALDDKIASNNRLAQIELEYMDTVYRAVALAQTPLEEIAEITMGTSPKSGDLNESATGIPFFQGGRDFTELIPSKRVFTEKPVRTAKPMSTLMTVRAPVGNVNLTVSGCAIGRGVAAFHSTDQAATLFTALASHSDSWEEIANTGTVFSSVTAAQVRNHVIQYPIAQNRSATETVLRPHLERAIAAVNENEVLARTRDELLPLLMNGTITVREAEDRTKEVL